MPKLVKRVRFGPDMHEINIKTNCNNENIMPKKIIPNIN